MNEKRTHSCGSLRASDAGREVILAGWVQRVRDMGTLVFVDLRDRDGLTQIVFGPERSALRDEAKALRPEFVVSVRGAVRVRAEGGRNPKMATGEIEVEASVLTVLNTADVPPFVITDPLQASEELRFKYRYLDLRRPSMQKNLRLRHDAALAVRNHLSGRGFLEIETPFMTKSTPEGARDYLVPSRVHKGRFYALPQSPQLFKQMLMIAGADKYFQIVRCFRDEDLRADRQPEFTQIDIEMSFAGREDVFELVEGLMAEVFALSGQKITTPFPRLSHREAMDGYGSDKPDLRAGMKIRDLTDIAAGTDSDILRKTAAEGGRIKGFVVEGGGSLSRTRIDRLNLRARELGGRGVAWIKRAAAPEEGWKSSLKMGGEWLRALWEKLEAGESDLALILADAGETALRVLGEIRRDFVLERVKGQAAYAFTWVTDFPLFEWSEEEQKLVAVHHPFTSPHPDDAGRLESDPRSVRALAYDIVLNGYEIGGGSIRIHDRSLQNRIFETLGLDKEEAREKFGFFLDALGYGTPPHGGIALGFDRIVMLLAGEESIREVIPFPKTTSALCLLTGSPSTVTERQLADLGLKLK